MPARSHLPVRVVAPLLAGLLAMTACSGDDDVADAEDVSNEATTTTAGEDAEPGDGEGDGDAPVAEGYPPQPEGVPFPTDEWPEGDVIDAAGLEVLEAAAETAFTTGDDAGNGEVSSIVVVQGGEIVFEAYNPAFGPDDVFNSWSMAKTFTAALVGLTVEDGLLTIADDSLREEWPADDPRNAITIEDLLHMASGLEWTEGVGYTEFFAEPDAAAWYATRELVEEPGTRFNYSTPETAMLAREAADALGGCPEQEAFMQERLLDPIGITSEEFVRDGSGCWYGGLGMNMTTRDFARFGLLLLRGGLWDGEQLLPTDWVDAMREPSPALDAYGYQTWLVDGGEAFAARGFQGQTILVVPDDDVVIAVNNLDGTDCPLISAALDELGSDVAAC